MKNTKRKTLYAIKNCLLMIIMFTIIFYGLLNICVSNRYVLSVSQQISDNINGIDASAYPGIKERIQELQNKYPNWRFKILYTNLDWNDVIRNEYQGHGASPKNLIYKSYDSSWVCSSCGNRPYDNGSWRCASENAIKYMIDPRNSLNASDIFQFEELTSSNENLSVVQSMTRGTFLQGHENGIINTARNNNVNAYYIVARLIQEQGKNGSQLVSGATGYYNAFNIGATGSSSSAVIANGLAYAKKKGWNTLEKSIDGGIGFVANEYIKKGQNTLYFQKFNVTANSTYWHQYQQNVTAAQTEGTTLRDTYKSINAMSSAHTFIIPVYKNMPGSVAARPGGTTPSTSNSSLVKVNVNSSLKIRRSPTDSTAIGWLWKDEIVVRLEKATQKINGTYWDKIQKSDGTVGYTARETFDYESQYKLYLIPIEENNNSSSNILRGDANGDGKITASDYVVIKNHIMGAAVLDANAKLRADTNGDGQVTASDYVLVKNKLMQ